ncbi:hypothetical protein HYY75_05550 [bacterium]|nr:hypothetical protein [bacterium]
MKIRWLVLSVVAFLVFSIFLSTGLNARVFAQSSQLPSDLTNLLSGKSWV